MKRKSWFFRPILDRLEERNPASDTWGYLQSFLSAPSQAASGEAPPPIGILGC